MQLQSSDFRGIETEGSENAKFQIPSSEFNFLQELQPSLNANVGSEGLLFYYM